MMRLISVIISVFLIGCAAMGMPGSISEKISGFDKTTETSMEPAWLSGGSGAIKLGLYKTSKMNEDRAVLEVVVKGAYNFAQKDSVEFNIDGDIISLKSMDMLTDIETKEGVYNSVAYLPATNWSSKRYEITKDLIKQMLEGQEVWVKVNLSKEYMEGQFSVDNPTAARPAFREFYKRIWGAGAGD